MCQPFEKQFSWAPHVCHFSCIYTAHRENCTGLFGVPPSGPPFHPGLLNTDHRFDGIFQSRLWWRASVWHTADFLVDWEHLLSSCWIPPRDIIKPLPTQLVFTGGCFASSKTTFFLLLQVKAERTHVKTFQIWNKHFHTGSYDAMHRFWLTQVTEWTAHTGSNLGRIGSGRSGGMRFGRERGQEEGKEGEMRKGREATIHTGS